MELDQENIILIGDKHRPEFTGWYLMSGQHF